MLGPAGYQKDTAPLLALGVANSEHRRYGTSSEHDRAHGLDATGIRRSIAEFLALAA